MLAGIGRSLGKSFLNIRMIFFLLQSIKSPLKVVGYLNPIKNQFESDSDDVGGETSSQACSQFSPGRQSDPYILFDTFNISFLSLISRMETFNLRPFKVVSTTTINAC